jgi:hypothetical protein
MEVEGPEKSGPFVFHDVSGQAEKKKQIPRAKDALGMTIP